MSANKEQEHKLLISWFDKRVISPFQVSRCLMCHLCAAAEVPSVWVGGCSTWRCSHLMMLQYGTVCVKHFYGLSHTFNIYNFIYSSLSLLGESSFPMKPLYWGQDSYFFPHYSCHFYWFFCLLPNYITYEWFHAIYCICVESLQTVSNVDWGLNGSATETLVHARKTFLEYLSSKQFYCNECDAILHCYSTSSSSSVPKN